MLNTLLTDHVCITHQPMVKCVTRCTTSWEACLTSVHTTRISWCWLLLLTSPVSPKDMTTPWLLWYLKHLVGSEKERNRKYLEDLMCYKLCYTNYVPLSIAAATSVLAGPWLGCHVGNPECCIVLVERIGTPVVQCVPVLGCCQP